MSRFLRINHQGRDLWWDGEMWNQDPNQRKDLTEREVSRVNRLFHANKEIEPQVEYRK